MTVAYDSNRAVTQRRHVYNAIISAMDRCPLI